GSRSTASAPGAPKASDRIPDVPNRVLESRTPDGRSDAASSREPPPTHQLAAPRALAAMLLRARGVGRVRPSEVLMLKSFADMLPDLGKRSRARSRRRGPAGSETSSTSPGPTAASSGAGRQLLLLDDEEAILVPTARYFRSLGWMVDLAQEPE